MKKQGSSNNMQEPETFDERGGVIRSGFLVKQGGRVKSWKRRYFVLAGNGTMYYFKDATTFAARGEIKMDGTWKAVPFTTPKLPFAFHLFSYKAFTKRTKRMSITKEPSDERVYVLICESEAELKAWVEDINRIVLRLGLMNTTPVDPTQPPPSHEVIAARLTLLQHQMSAKDGRLSPGVAREKRIPSSPKIMIQPPSEPAHSRDDSAYPDLEEDFVMAENSDSDDE